MIILNNIISYITIAYYNFNNKDENNYLINYVLNFILNPDHIPFLIIILLILSTLIIFYNKCYRKEDELIYSLYKIHLIQNFNKSLKCLKISYDNNIIKNLTLSILKIKNLTKCNLILDETNYLLISLNLGKIIEFSLYSEKGDEYTGILNGNLNEIKISNITLYQSSILYVHIFHDINEAKINIKFCGERVIDKVNNIKLLEDYIYSPLFTYSNCFILSIIFNLILLFTIFLFCIPLNSTTLYQISLLIILGIFCIIILILIFLKKVIYWRKNLL